MTPEADIVVRGAGPVGCVLALALAGSRHSVRLADPNPSSARGFRPIALSHASRLILERVGAWGAFPATPIRAIHVSQSGGFGRTLLDAADARVPALGYVTQYADLLAALRARVHVEPLDAASPRCTVHAEGSDPRARARSYGQEAVVARVASEPASGATAYERFTPGGPLALLPLAGTWAIVWAQPEERAAALLDAPPHEFLDALQRDAGERAGRFTAVHERARAALALRLRFSRVEGREVYVGNAAQTLHPVAGQGLNLGLRDAWDLARVLRDAEDPGSAHALARFAALRRIDAAAAIGVTELLARGFLGGNVLAQFVRGVALTGLDVVAPARRFFARRMIFGPSALP